MQTNLFPNQQPTVHLLWDNCALAIINSDAQIEKLLSYWENQLILDEETYDRKSERVLVHMFNVLNPSSPRTIQAHQGAITEVVDHLKKRGLDYIIHDKREALPAPDLKRMNGFRFSQRQMITDALMQFKSGCVEAPTRYGKTTLLINAARAFPTLRIIITAPGQDLVKQLYEDVKERIPHRDVKLLPYKTKTPGQEITVCSMDSLDKVPADWPQLVLIDEPHASVTTSRIQQIAKFCMARKIAFGATLSGRYDNRDRLIRHITGPTLACRTFQEAVTEGAICQIVVIFIKFKFNHFSVNKRDAAYNRILFRNNDLARMHARICSEIIPNDYQTISFIGNEKQANLFLDRMNDDAGVIAMAKKMKVAERREMMARMASGEVKRCLASRIYAQGVTFSDLRCMINLEGGGDSCGTIQKPGRLAEIREGKKCGVVFDFLFDCPQFDTTNLSDIPSNDTKWTCAIRDSRARLKAYKKKGYDIRIVENLEEAKQVFEEVI
jgi:superfamily II DNA or RNA helicase